MDSVTGANPAGNVPRETRLDHVALECRFVSQYAVLGEVAQPIGYHGLKIAIYTLVWPVRGQGNRTDHTVPGELASQPGIFSSAVSNN